MKKRKGIIIQARLTSTRLPGKVLQNLGNYSMIEYIVRRLNHCTIPDLSVVAIPDNPESDQLAHHLAERSIPFFRGSENDVLNRYIETAHHFGIDIIVRATGDNPFTFPEAVDRCLTHHLTNQYNYTTTSGLPLGMGIETVDTDILESLDSYKLEQYHHEHVTLFIRENRALFKTAVIPFGYNDKIRVTVDENADFQVALNIIRHFGQYNRYISAADICALYNEKPELFSGNAHVIQRKK